jgi:hypothetical protein
LFAASFGTTLVATPDLPAFAGATTLATRLAGVFPEAFFAALLVDLSSAS